MKLPSLVRTSLNQAITLQEKDTDRAWRGLLATANNQFQQHDDVSMLLRLMNDVRDILEGFVQSMAGQ